MKPVRAAFAAVALGTAVGLSGCSKPADVASTNLSTAADNFQIERQINFINTITNTNIVSVRGLCSLGNDDQPGQRTVTCKVGKDEKGQDVFIKNFFGLSSTVTYSVVQIGPAGVNSAKYDVQFNPSVLVPNFRTAGGDPLTPIAPAPAASASSDQAQATRPPVAVLVPQ